MTPELQHELEEKLLAKVKRIELPPNVRAGLIVRSVKENWTHERFKFEQARAKFMQFFDELAEDVDKDLLDPTTWDEGEVTPC